MAGNRFQTCLLLGLFFIPLSTAVATLGKPGMNDLAKNELKKYLYVCAHEKTMGAVTHDGKFFVKKDHRSVLVACGFTNPSTKNIRSIKGVLKFSTYFGNPVFEMSVQENLSLSPGQEAMRERTLQRVDFINEETFAVFMATPLSRLRQEWMPVEMVLSDGAVLRP
jgi:hypothetical protein